MRRYLLGLLLCSSSMMAQDVNTDFQAFRKDMLGNYSGFRKSVLDDYANYLNGIWEEFQVFRGIKKNKEPKPVNIPKAEDIPTQPTPQNLPKPEDIPVTKPIEDKPFNRPTHPLAPSVPTITLVFYGMKLNVASANPCQLTSLEHQDIAKIWKSYQKDATIKNVILSLNQQVKDYHLNDWFAYELVSTYVTQILSGASASAKALLEHYILVNMGYDIRLASTNTRLWLLIPTYQQVYERSYLMLEGRKYYVFGEDSKKIQETSSLYTCELPKEADKGRSLNLILGKQGFGILSTQQHHYLLSDGNIQIQGSVNTETMEALRHYPQMDVVYYAKSVVNPIFRQELLAQMKPQIASLPQHEAANKLLHFVQYAFDYATDQEQFGYEKPYFLEENFYYPKNDCEDRAILYAFLVHELLGLDVHLVQFPGHECTAVHFTDSSITGDYYTYQGEKYLICDPTYIGAPIGLCMPNFKSNKPKVEIWK